MNVLMSYRATADAPLAPSHHPDRLRHGGDDQTKPAIHGDSGWGLERVCLV